MHKVLKKAISSLPLENRMKKIFRREKIHTVSGLVRRSENWWRTRKGVGQKFLNCVQGCLDDLNIQAAEEAGVELPERWYWSHDPYPNLRLGMSPRERREWRP